MHIITLDKGVVGIRGIPIRILVVLRLFETITESAVLIAAGGPEAEMRITSAFF